MLWGGVLPEAGEGEAASPQLNLHSAKNFCFKSEKVIKRGRRMKLSSLFLDFFQDCMGIFAKQAPPVSLN